MIDHSALEIESGAELERFDLGMVVIGGTRYTVLTGFEGTGKCFWCGGVLKGKLKRYCRGHMVEYYRHFEWASASRWARERAGNKCENCGCAEWYIRNGYNLRTQLEVHHIVPLRGAARYFTVYNLPWNLIALCKACHQEVSAVMRNSTVRSAPTPLSQYGLAIAQGQLELICV